MRFFTLDDFDTKGKTVFLRVDMNCPIDPESLEVLDLKRVQEATESLKDLEGAKIVFGSHQGRVGNKDYIGTASHAKALEKILGREIRYVEDVMGSEARREIKNMKEGEILLLDNLRFCAEENYEFLPEDASKTVMVSRLSKMFDLSVLDSFPSAHRSHPSLVGFSHILPSCAGKLVEREVRKLDEVMTVTKKPHVVVLGGSKVIDRLESINTLIQSGRADQVLLTGVLANVFMRAQGRIRYPLGIKRENEVVAKAHQLIGDYPDVFQTPVDVAIDNDGERMEVNVRNLHEGERVLDLGQETVDHYTRLIHSAGTVFMSGPPGLFENEHFRYGTHEVLKAVSESFATTIVSGGHLTAALKKYGFEDKVHHISTAGGALVLYLSGKKLPMIQSLEYAATKYSQQKEKEQKENELTSKSK